MNKKKLLELIQKKEARKAALLTKAQASEDVTELRGINIEIDALNTDIAELRSMADALPDDPAPAAPAATPAAPATPAAVPGAPEGRGAQPPLNVLGTYGTGALPAAPQPGEPRGLDAIIAIKDTNEMRSELLKAPEYRSAYLKMLQGRELGETERRAITTAAGTGGAAIPTTTYDKIIEKMRQTSVLFPLISATYIPGNVNLPVASALNASQWTSEANAPTTGDDTVATVSLTGYTLIKISSLSVAVRVMSIDAFETYIVNQIGQQLAIAVENAILTGAGPTGTPPQPSGIISGVTWDATNSNTWAHGSPVGYDDLVGLLALLNSVYRPFAKLVLNRNTEAQVRKIKSTTNFPIFSQSPQTGFQQKILGVDYLVDEYCPDSTILYICPSYYYMNFSQPPVIEANTSSSFKSALIDYRGLLVADGKPALSEAFCKLSMAAS